MNRIPARILSVATALSAWTIPPCSAASDAPVGGIQDTVRIGRTMRLLAESKPERRNTVRILFYGQSITKQDWWKQVVDGLKRHYPDADIVAANAAIGGFSSRMLVHTVRRDVAAFYPDLLVFHVYGDHRRYEDIVRIVRSETTAEILVQNDHVNGNADPAQADSGWTGFMNGRFVPAVCEAYGCCLADIRGGWRRRLIDAGTPVSALLADGLHLNDAGCDLMAELVLAKLAEPPADAAGRSPAEDWVRTFVVGEDVFPTNGVLSLAFEGNRVVALAGAGTGTATVTIDGAAPSDIAAIHQFTRANDGPGVDWPWNVSVPVQIGSQANPRAQDWTLTVTEGSNAWFAFTLAGSVTGPDGGGDRKTPFVSDSGQVSIDPAHWFLGMSPKGAPSPIAPGYAITFRSEPRGIDTYEAAAEDPGPEERAVVLASGLDNGSHTLRIDGPAAASIRAIRVHRPPLRPDTPRARVSSRVNP